MIVGIIVGSETSEISCNFRDWCVSKTHEFEITVDRPYNDLNWWNQFQLQHNWIDLFEMIIFHFFVVLLFFFIVNQLFCVNMINLNSNRVCQTKLNQNQSSYDRQNFFHMIEKKRSNSTSNVEFDNKCVWFWIAVCRAR